MEQMLSPELAATQELPGSGLIKWGGWVPKFSAYQTLWSVPLCWSGSMQGVSASAMEDEQRRPDSLAASKATVA